MVFAAVLSVLLLTAFWLEALGLCFFLVDIGFISFAQLAAFEELSSMCRLLLLSRRVLQQQSSYYTTYIPLCEDKYALKCFLVSIGCRASPRNLAKMSADLFISSLLSLLFILDKFCCLVSPFCNNLAFPICDFFHSLANFLLVLLFLRSFFLKKQLKAILSYSFHQFTRWPVALTFFTIFVSVQFRGTREVNPEFNHPMRFDCSHLSGSHQVLVIVCCPWSGRYVPC